jgi:hypothetical protein
VRACLSVRLVDDLAGVKAGYVSHLEPVTGLA